MLPSTFSGTQYWIADKWFSMLPVDQFASRPIKYLEIGTLHGANLLSVLTSYASHPGSIAHCIDPWCDYSEYTEYQGKQDVNYTTFMNNLTSSGLHDKVVVHRGYSYDEVPKFERDLFDLIYVDGNHNPDAVMEDAVLSFRILKVGGIMIFDDYWPNSPPADGIDGFVRAYRDRIRVVGKTAQQMFIQRLN